MNEALYTFESLHQGDKVTLLLAILVALGAFGGMFFLLRKSGDHAQRNYRLLGAMLLFFVFLMASSTAFFSNLFMKKLGPVVFYETAMETPYGRVAYADIRNAYIHLDKQPSMINPMVTRKTTRMLVIEEKEGKTHVLPAKNYPIEEILSKMKALIIKE